jgi:hypothetical protein
MKWEWSDYKILLETKHQNKYDYSKVEWKGVDGKIIVVCILHGDFNIRAQAHKDGQGCKKCKKQSHINYNQLKNDDFIKKSIEIWGNIYEICKKHGEFNQLPHNHYKYGCGRCGYDKNKNNIKKNYKCNIEFISKANKIHNFIYDYSKSIYINTISKLIVICKIHGEFYISPNNHLGKKGCVGCYNENKKKRINGPEEYYEKFKILYGDKYDYSNVVWKGGSKLINIICRNHGEFSIYPYLHKKGKECPRCSNQHSSISIDWLKYMEIKYSVKIQHAQNLGEFIIPGSRYKADGYIKSLNTIFEFYGDFWHGNPKLYDKTLKNPRTCKTYGDLYKKTVKKSNYIKKNGYNLIEIWENDWKIFIKSIKCIQNKWRTKLKTKTSFIVGNTSS